MLMLNWQVSIVQLHFQKTGALFKFLFRKKLIGQLRIELLLLLDWSRVGMIVLAMFLFMVCALAFQKPVVQRLGQNRRFGNLNMVGIYDFFHKQCITLFLLQHIYSSSKGSWTIGMKQICSLYHFSQVCLPLWLRKEMHAELVSLHL